MSAHMTPVRPVTAGLASLENEVADLGCDNPKDYFTVAAPRTPSRLWMGIWFGVGVSVMGNSVLLFGVLLMLADGRR